MGFQSRSEFINSQASQKTIAAWVEGVERLHIWSLDAGAIYVRDVDHWVVGLKQGQDELVEAADRPSLGEGEWFYDKTESKLYVWPTGSTNPQTDEEMIARYRFFFANHNFAAPYNFEDGAPHAQYVGRIDFQPPYKHKIGVEQGLTSLIGNGTLRLINTDGGLDEIFDTIIFENKDVTIFSWNRDLDYSDARVIFRGLVTEKIFTPDNVSFKVKDLLFALEQEVPQNVFDENDDVNESIQGRQKRWIFGRVAGLQLQSTQQTSDGVALTGTVSAAPSNTTLTGTGTSFLSELSPNDTITIGTQEFNIESIESDTKLTLDDLPTFAFTAQTATYIPERPLRTQNREFLVADHACAKLTKTVVRVIQFNRVELNDTTGIEAGDFLEFSTSERVEVRNVAPGNIVVLRQNLILIPSVSSSVVRQPIQKVFVESDDVRDADFTISNVVGETKVTLSDDAEFNIARAKNTGIDLTFTNGSRRVTYAGTENLEDILESRDFIRPIDITFSTWYEILSVGQGFTLTGTIASTNTSTALTGTGTLFLSEVSPGDTIRVGEIDFTVDTVNSNTSITLDAPAENTISGEVGRIEDENTIELRVPFADPNHTGGVEAKRPNYISDSTKVSAEVLGRTVDGQPEGDWIQTAAEAIRDLLSELNISQVNEGSFTQGKLDNRALVSVAVPFSPSDSAIKTKDVIDAIAKSTFSSVTLDNDLKIKFQDLTPDVPNDLVTIRDEDVVSWSISTVNGKNIRNTIIEYQHQDLGRYTQEEAVRTKTFTSSFVRDYVETNKTSQEDAYIFDEFDANIHSQRVAYYRSLSRADITITSDLRLENIEIGDTVELDFRRLYKRFGDSTSRKKLATVIGKKITGEKTVLELTDFGNVFNRTCYITDNSAPDYSASSEEEKLIYGYITENNGIVDDDEETDNINLIS